MAFVVVVIAGGVVEVVLSLDLLHPFVTLMITKPSPSINKILFI